MVSIRLKEILLHPLIQLYDDPLIDGIQFDFRLIRPKQKEILIKRLSAYLPSGIVLAIKWSTIDEAHFNFGIRMNSIKAIKVLFIVYDH